jgi:hypothetical protein
MLTTASANAQYSSRPADEKFKTLADIRANAELDRLSCRAGNRKLHSMETVVAGENIALRSKETGAIASLTHWSFNQLARIASAPAGFLRELPAPMSVDILNHRIANAPNADVQMYARIGADKGLTARALTTPDYKRLHDVTVIDALLRTQEIRPTLDLPPVWEGGKGGAYRGDRDMFVIMVDGGSIVDDPTIGFGGSNGQMYRGIIARNSEVGRAKIEILTFLFRGICGNHNIWGVEGVDISSHRHVGKVAERFDAAIRNAMKFMDRPASDDVDRIKALAAAELGKDRAEVVTAGRTLGLTETQADSAYDAAEQHEPNPRSIWGYAQGITRMSQDTAYQDDRFTLDLLAAKLMRRKVAA